MAVVVLVYGIAQEQLGADTLEAEWLPALAGGIRLAGFPDLADRIRNRPTPDGIECRMAFYGHLFLRPGQQGAGADDLTAEQETMAEALAFEWLKRAAQRGVYAEDQTTARRELRDLEAEPVQERQGVLRRTARRILASVARLRWFAPFGMGFAERFVWKALSQVTRYLTDEEIRREAQRAVLSLLGPETRVLIGHSLGSVVAYEVAQRLERELPLLLTIGSPLGLDTIVYPRLRPQPPTFPPHVRRWVNVWDENDLVAAEAELGPRFPERPEGAVLKEQKTVYGRTVDNGAEPHSGKFYLGKMEVGHPVGKSLRI
jgi:hypothetical protein